MKKRLAVLVLLMLAAMCAFAAAEVEINETNFPDEVFRNYVFENFNLGRKDYILSDDEIAEAKSVHVPKMGIKSLKGIEYLSCLKNLCCDENELTELDLSKNSTLESVMCNCNQLTSLNVRYLKMLTSLQCYKNKLTSLNLNESLFLEYFDCDDNLLTSLDVTRFSRLEKLYCGRQEIQSLDLSKCPKLVDLSVCGTSISSLDLSVNTVLKIIQADGCNKLKTLDVSKNTKLQWLWIANTAISRLDISKCPVLVRLVKENEPTKADNTLKWGTSQSNEPGLWINDDVELITEANPVAVTKIKLNKTKLTLTRTGKKTKPTFQLKATVLPTNASNQKVAWKSSDAKVAKVDQTGKVTALKVGTATITCTARDGSGVKATCKVTVKAKKVTAITLSKTKASLRKGKTLQLKVKKIEPADALNQKVKWSTSDKKVAIVDAKGKVKAVGKGICVITCTAADGSKVKATCKITVK